MAQQEACFMCWSVVVNPSGTELLLMDSLIVGLSLLAKPWALCYATKFFFHVFELWNVSGSPKVMQLCMSVGQALWMNLSEKLDLIIGNPLNGSGLGTGKDNLSASLSVTTFPPRSTPVVLLFRQRSNDVLPLITFHHPSTEEIHGNTALLHITLLLHYT